MGPAVGKSRDDDEPDQRQFQRCNRHLDVAPQLHAAVVQQSEREDQDDGENLAVAQFERTAVRAERQRKRIKNRLQRRKEIRQINKKSGS